MSAGCGGCPSDSRVTTVGSPQVALEKPAPPAPPPVPEPETVPEKAAVPAPPAPEEVMADLSAASPPPVPAGTFEAEDLTMRLREKMAEAYGGDLAKVPQAKIYLSNGTLQELIDFYEQRGYRVQRVSVPVTRILQPVLRDKPDLASRIRLEDYEGVVIHQVMIEGTGMSAADKYIDPDTYQVIDRLFVTEMPVR